MLDREMGVVSGADHADTLLQAFKSLVLPREGVVLDMIGPGDLVKDLQPALVPDLLIQPPDRLLVAVSLLPHRDLLRRTGCDLVIRSA
jgi:hypothetical protein